ncbi:band 4.1-like protein 4 [Cynoglossus semilaevis]|uniref:band 4.1-like protein 4 n=1 Tax=Cynoglossus semilaevis TaxID=244447 RepID=UPI000497D1DA|nr:band 4.1-like protein 4A [Cynoglossus semilaevis]
MACFRGNREEFYGEVLLLDDTKITLKPEQGMKKSTKVSAILEQVFCHLNVVDVKFFGLRFCDKKQHTNWLDTSKTLSQHRSLPGPPYIFYFGVKFYAKDPVKLKDEGTRRQFYLQLRQDIRRRCLLVPYYLRPRLFALMMQVELGDFTDGEMVETEENRETLVIYKSMRGVSRPQAESLFLALSSSLPMYGVSLFNAYGGNQSEYFLGPSPVGIDVYKNRALVGKYLWQKITKLHFKNDTFELRVAGKQDSETTFFFHSPECKRLWKTCVEHHVFFRMSESDPPRLTHSSVTSSPALSLPRLNVSLRRHRSDANTTTTTTTATKEAKNTTESEGSKPVKKLTAPPAVDRLEG